MESFDTKRDNSKTLAEDKEKRVSIDECVDIGESIAKDLGLPMDRWAKDTRKDFSRSVAFSCIRSVTPYNEMSYKFVGSAIRGDLAPWYANAMRISLDAPHEWQSKTESSIIDLFKSKYPQRKDEIKESINESGSNGLKEIPEDKMDELIDLDITMTTYKGKPFWIFYDWRTLNDASEILEPGVADGEFDDSVILDYVSDYGFADEWFECLGLGEARPYLNSQYVTDYAVIMGDLYSGDYIRESDEVAEEYINTLVNNPKHANTIVDDETLKRLGYTKVNNDESYEHGWYDRQDNPTEIFNKLKEEFGNDIEVVFSVSYAQPFATGFDVWMKDFGNVDKKEENFLSESNQTLTEGHVIQNYKGFELDWNDDGIDPDEGEANFNVYISYNGKKLTKDVYGKELVFRGFNQAKRWIDENVKEVKYTTKDKIKQLYNIFNRYDEVEIMDDILVLFIAPFGVEEAIIDIKSFSEIYCALDIQSMQSFLDFNDDVSKEDLLKAWPELNDDNWRNVVDITYDNIDDVSLPTVKKFTSLTDLVDGLAGYYAIDKLSQDEYEKLVQETFITLNGKPLKESKQLTEGHDMSQEYKGFWLDFNDDQLDFDVEEGTSLATFNVDIMLNDKILHTANGFRAAREWVDKNGDEFLKKELLKNIDKTHWVVYDENNLDEDDYIDPNMVTGIMSFQDLNCDSKSFIEFITKDLGLNELNKDYSDISISDAMSIGTIDKVWCALDCYDSGTVNWTFELNEDGVLAFIDKSLTKLIVRHNGKIYFPNDIALNSYNKMEETLNNFFKSKVEEKLIQSSSDKALQQNIETEIKAGKSPKQAAAIAYSVQRENENMNEKLDLTYGFDHIKSVARLVYNALTTQLHSQDIIVGTHKSGTAFYVIVEKRIADPKKVKEIILNTLEDNGYEPEKVKYMNEPEAPNAYAYLIDDIIVKQRMTMSYQKTESINDNDTQYGVHSYSQQSIIFRGTEEECGKFIEDNELWDDAEIYTMTSDDPHYIKGDKESINELFGKGKKANRYIVGIGSDKSGLIDIGKLTSQVEGILKANKVKDIKAYRDDVETSQRRFFSHYTNANFEFTCDETTLEKIKGQVAGIKPDNVSTNIDDEFEVTSNMISKLIEWGVVNNSSATNESATLHESNMKKNVPEFLWSDVCSNRLDKVKQYFEKHPNSIDRRYYRFSMEHSLIMGALRNGNLEMVKLLKDLGETILEHEQKEYDDRLVELEEYPQAIRSGSLELLKDPTDDKDDTISEATIHMSKSEMDKLDKEVEDATKEVAKYNIPMKAKKTSANTTTNGPDFDAIPENQRESAKKAYDRYSKAVKDRPDRAKDVIVYDESLKTENKGSGYEFEASYIFPKLTSEDEFKLLAYGLTVTDNSSKDDTEVSGSLNDIKRFAKEWLDYELVDDYLTMNENYGDDDYYDDWEESNLYGGDLTYCPICNHKLVRDEDGDSYCPDCEEDSHSLSLKRRNSDGDDSSVNESIIGSAILTSLGTSIGSSLIGAVKNILTKDPSKKKSKWTDYKGHLIEQDPTGAIRVYDGKSKQLGTDVEFHTMKQAQQFIKDAKKSNKKRQ